MSVRQAAIDAVLEVHNRPIVAQIKRLYAYIDASSERIEKILDTLDEDRIEQARSALRRFREEHHTHIEHIRSELHNS